MKIKLTFRSEDFRAMDSFIQQAIDAFKTVGCEVFGPVPLPTRASKSLPKADSYLGSLIKGRRGSEVHLRALVVDGQPGVLVRVAKALHKPDAVQVEIA